MGMRISLGSGATLATQLVDGAHMQIISGVTLNPSSSYIGLVSVSGAVSVSNFVSPNVGNVTLNASPNQIGSVTISNTPSVAQSGTWNVGVTGLVSLPSGTEIRSLATILNTVTVTGTVAATQSGTWNAGITGLISLASGSEVRSLATILNFPATQAVTQSGTWNVGLNHLVSLASGTEVRTRPVSNITLNSSDAHIGSVSIFGNLTTTVGAVTLNPGPAQIGSVTISNIPAVSQSGTWNLGLTHLISLASGQLISINDGGNSITVDNGGTFAVQAAQSGTWNTGVTGLISLASGTEILVRHNSNVTLNSSSAHIGSVSIFGSVNTTVGMITLFPGPNQIGSVTISNTPAVTQSGTWTVGLSHLVSLASGQLVSINDGGNSITVDNGGTFAVQAAQSGTWTVQPGNTANTTPWLVTQSGGLISLASGTEVRVRPVSNITLNASDAFIGLTTTVVGNTVTVGTHAVTQSGTWNVGFTGNATLNPSPNYIGLVTIIPTYLSTYTSFSTIISASGNATLFVPPASQRWVLKDLFISSLGNSYVQISSSSNPIIPYTALATTGGFVISAGDSGIRAKAVDQSFVVQQNALATISIMANVRFE